MIQLIDGLPIRLRFAHNLDFLERWGTVFQVLDQQDSGNLCFGIDGVDGRVFVKYTGAETERANGSVDDAVAVARRSVEVYRELSHPSMVNLRFAGDIGDGFVRVFDWVDGTPLGRAYERRQEIAGLGSDRRSAAVQQIYDFHVHVSALGWVAVDLYDASVLIDLLTAQVTMCDLDAYERAPMRNRMGRMWGSTRFMSPEEFELGASIDERTNVFALGALAHTLLGDDATKNRDAWIGSHEQFAVSTRALSPSRADRWPTVAALADAWRAASAFGAAQ